MREHDQPRRRMLFRVRLGFILAASLCGLVAAAEDPRAALAGLVEPIELVAARAVVWDDPDGRWVVLTGKASAVQAGRGAAAENLVVRITTHKADGGTIFQTELYPEGEVRAPKSGEEPRAILRTTTDVKVKSMVDRVKSPPRELAALLERAGFPAAVPAVNDPPGPLPREVIEAQAVVPAPARHDPEVKPAQGFDPQEPPSIELPPIDATPEVQVPNLDRDFDPAPEPEMLPAPLPGDVDDPLETPGLAPLPGFNDNEPAPPLRPDQPRVAPGAATPGFRGPVLPGSEKRSTLISPRSARPLDVKEFRNEGTHTIIVRGGVQVVSEIPGQGTVDISAESAVIWRHPDPKKDDVVGPQGERIEDPAQPMEIYLEGNVILRQDENQWAGRADQRTFRADKLYYDFVTERIMAVQGQVDVFAPNLISPMKLKAPRLEQFRPVVVGPDGQYVLGKDPEIRADRTVSTGSRFPNPAYKIYNRSITLTRQATRATDPNSGKPMAGDPQEQVWRYDARTNLFFMGPIPIFYWPRFVGETDDLDPPLRMIGFRTNNYFGQQLLTDWNGFKLFGIKRPSQIDNWNVDIDYLSARTKTFPALGSELGWYGADLISDLRDPYRRDRFTSNTFTKDYFGYFDIWGLQDKGIDVLGSGPAIVTNGPPGAGSVGYQRSGVPAFQDIRGRFNIRHMQRFIPDDEDHPFEDLRLQTEVAYTSDRHFLEEYYKRLFDAGMDQETLVFGQWQRNNWAMSLQTEANLQDFLTDTQWLPKFDYYRLGDTFLGDRLVYFNHTGVDYANTHTDIMVNNHNLFPLKVGSSDLAFIPFDPISNTSGVFSAGRGYTNHEVDLPLNFGDVLRVVPYLQGQATGWTDQIGGGYFNQLSTGAQGRLWGAAGVHAETTMWKVYSGVDSELFNIHGLNNKVSFFGDYRTAYSTVQLNNLAIQDDLDDNTYEYVRRYFAITLWNNGLLPYNYDPRHLILRRTLSPISGPNDVQASIETLNFGVHQRLQTKRGPEGKRRIVDWMTLDASTTYFPNAQRDNMGKPWGQTMYNYQWFLGDRTSIISTGWFEYWNLIGSTPQDNYLVNTFNPKGLNFITTGVMLSRPPRGSVYIGYSVINSGMIETSALNVSMSYWLSPKWYGTFSNSYDFGNKVPLGSMFSFTRIGADYLTSIGLSVDPQRQSYMFAFQISPRLAPTLRLGSGTGLNQFDSRLAPVQ
ncbi:hypothetical protein [Paludisphaera rhizosphaerae]|uniref:hypothetical protein n=1 Tax=Paludisphaera rhizosphaerae TaxID=2711216 RepID=UPI0013ECE9C7|nr:hypothetical protein [Paludisphaera rhizosphaerae]